MSLTKARKIGNESWKINIKNQNIKEMKQLKIRKNIKHLIKTDSTKIANEKN